MSTTNETPARQEGETPRVDAAWQYCYPECERPNLELARTLERELSAKQAELEALKAAQGQVLEAFDPNVMKPILIGEFKQQLLTHDEEGEECYQDVFIHWDVIKQIMRAIKEHALPTPPVERSVDGE